MKIHFIYDPNHKVAGSTADVRVHKAGCADIAKEAKTATSHYESEAASQQEAAEDFHADFISEGSVTAAQALSYTAFAPCTKGLPAKARAKAAAKGEPGPEGLAKMFPIGTATSSRTRSRQRQTTAQRKQVASVTSIKDKDKAKTATLTRAQARKMASDAAARQAEQNKAPSQQGMPANGKLTREQKTQLATVIVTAAAGVMDQLDGVGLKGVSQDEAAQTVANWLHHLPVDRARWPQELPKPQRSDWR